jgi:hypothetical protein
LRVFRKGLREGDVVVVSGLQRVRPGIAVSPRKTSMTASLNRSQSTVQPGSVPSEGRLREANARE